MGDIEEGVLLVPVSEAAAALNVCRHTLYRMRNAEQIRFVKLRGKTLVPVSELERLSGGKQEPELEPVEEPKKARPKKIKLIPRVA